MIWNILPKAKGVSDFDGDKRKAAGHPGRVTSGTKHNMLPRSDGLFREQVEAVAGEFPDIELETPIIDDLAHRLVARPHDLDVVLLPNQYGDILSDAAGALVGGLGLAASGCYGDDYAYFESAHGTAPDIAGQGIANPIAQIRSLAMLLRYSLGHPEASRAIKSAIDATIDAGFRTGDLATDAPTETHVGTAAMTDAIIARL